MNVTDEMVNRFLAWRIPADFDPDCGISFDGRKPNVWNPSPTWDEFAKRLPSTVADSREG